uniref:Uncharacterized protein n=1 Tax=Photinus pyralis TaxID=7054 RepID=A0A1Y1M2P1_PHOPY
MSSSSKPYKMKMVVKKENGAWFLERNVQRAEGKILVGQYQRRREQCSKCVVCVARNGPQRRPKAPMRQYNVGSPFKRVLIDIAGSFPESDGGNVQSYIMGVMNYFRTTLCQTKKRLLSRTFL